MAAPRAVIAVALASAVLALAAPVRAEQPSAPQSRPRATYVAVGVGGYLALAGVGELGPAAELEVYPGAWERFGVRAAYYGFDDDFEGALVTAGVTYQGAASRPHVHLALHADLAFTARDPSGNKIGAGGGVQSQLWVFGPLALGLDVTAHVLFNRDEIVLNLAGASTLRLSF